jgi:hypothetical protein
MAHPHQKAKLQSAQPAQHMRCGSWTWQRCWAGRCSGCSSTPASPACSPMSQLTAGAVHHQVLLGVCCHQPSIHSPAAGMPLRGCAPACDETCLPLLPQGRSLTMAGYGDQPSSKRTRLSEPRTCQTDPDGQRSNGQQPCSIASVPQVPLPPGAMQSLSVQRQPLPSLERRACMTTLPASCHHPPTSTIALPTGTSRVRDQHTHAGSSRSSCARLTEAGHWSSQV